MSDLAREPTAEECSTHARVTVYGREGWACWYPQMGGYIGRCVIVADNESCFNAYVWHDGDFPFGEDDGHEGREPRELHHCDPEQFVRFGQIVKLMVMVR